MLVERDETEDRYNTVSNKYGVSVSEKKSLLEKICTIETERNELINENNLVQSKLDKMQISLEKMKSKIKSFPPGLTLQ